MFYEEFTMIYIMLGVVIALLIAVIVLLIRLSGQRSSAPMAAPVYQQTYPGAGVVFCKHCATQFDAAQAYCPKCGTPRY